MQKIQCEAFGFLSMTENKLVYYEIYPSAREAILREKQIKAGSRQKKINFIIENNPEFKDLSA